MKVSSILLAASVALFASAAQAQSSIDITKITCNQYLFDKIAPSKSIAVWLAGYYNGTKHNTTIDLTRMDQEIDKVEDYCRLHLDTTLMDAAKAALGLGQ